MKSIYPYILRAIAQGRIAVAVPDEESEWYLLDMPIDAAAIPFLYSKDREMRMMFAIAMCEAAHGRAAAEAA